MKLPRYSATQKFAVAGFALLFAVAGTIALRISLGAPVSDEAATEQLVIMYKPGASVESLEPELVEHKAVEVEEIKALRAEVIKVPSSRARDVINELSKDPRVESVEPDYPGTPSATTPNDPEYSKQQGWVVTKTNELWDVTKGTDMIVAVMDTGVTLSHPDMSGKFVSGYDFADNDDNPTESPFSTRNGHGTAVSGVVAAKSNNGVGVAGGCWNCRIMPLKVFRDEDGFAASSVMADAIRHAADQGVRLANISVSFNQPSSVIEAAVDYAYDKGMLIVSSAHNDGVADPRYPAAFPKVISVGNTNMDDTLYETSDFGDTVDVAAPGVGIRTTAVNGAYSNWTGTSFSAPAIAAIAALLMAAHPDATNEDIRKAIVDNGDPCCSNNPEFYGDRVNAIKAHQYLESLPPPDTVKPTVTVTAPAANATVSGTVNITATASDNVGITKVEVQAGSGAVTADETAPYSIAWNTTTVADGAHTIKVTAYDAAGNTTVVNVPVTVKNAATLQGDLNNDSKVNLTDLSILLSNWNSANAAADINASGKVDLTDLSILLSKWTG